MDKNIKKFEKKIQLIIDKNDEETNWKRLLKYHHQKIEFYQNERLIHLLVTLFFGLFTLVTLFFSIAIGYWYILIATFLFLILLIPYIIHYMHLENNVQRLYKQFDQIYKKLSEHK